MSTQSPQPSSLAAPVGFSSLTSSPSQPGVLNGTFSFTFPDSFTTAPGAVVTGSFHFDSTLLDPNFPFQAIPLSSLEVNLLGQTFSLLDNLFGTPTADFFSGVFAGIEYDAVLPSNFPLIGFTIAREFFQAFDQNFNSAEGPIAYSPLSDIPPMEGLTLIGTPGDDFLIGTAGSDSISGLDGNDTLLSLSGNDHISGGNGDDLITAGSGNDTVDGEVGDDQVFGGGGNDTITGGDGVDVIFGDDGNGSGSFGSNNDQISGGKGKDRIFGEAGNDQINGDDSDDNLDGGEGSDTISGGSGKDRIFGSFGDDQLSGNAGNDQINGDVGFDFLDGGDGNDFLFGGTEGDTLLGGAGTDLLEGGSGFDVLDGGSGNDKLTGVDSFNPQFGFGAFEVDTLTGGTGNDTFVLGDATRVYYEDGNSTTSGDSDYALITDFSASRDVVQLKGSADLYSFDFFTNSAGTLSAGLIYDPGVTARGELIAVFENAASTLSITAPAFKFV